MIYRHVYLLYHCDVTITGDDGIFNLNSMRFVSLVIILLQKLESGDFYYQGTSPTFQCRDSTFDLL